MVKKIDNMKPNKLHIMFPVISPCDCYREEASARYNVRIIGSDKTQNVTNVFLKCTCCGSEKLFDVKINKKMFSDIKF